MKTKTASKHSAGTGLYAGWALLFLAAFILFGAREEERNQALERIMKPSHAVGALPEKAAIDLIKRDYLEPQKSDHIDDETWLNVLGQLALPIAALYTSGGRSIHALLKVDAKTADELRQMADKLGPFFAKLGGDWKALTGVRLTRLPMCYREGKTKKNDQGKLVYHRFPQPQLQRLLWLDDCPTVEGILTKPRLRVLDGSGY